MRLGFSIAAHLNAEILIIDEVLAVGDAPFQEKCIKKINELGTQGSTILFVSHNINAVLSLCAKGAFLEAGRLIAYEPIEQCVSRYVRACPVAGLRWEGNAGDEHIRFYQASLHRPAANVGFYYQGEKTTLELQFEVLKSLPNLILGFSVLNSRNQMIARTRLCDREEHQEKVHRNGHHTLSFALDLDLFHPGEYQIRLDWSLLNQKNILENDILLKFAVYSKNTPLKYELGVERDGISLGNRWSICQR